MGWLTIMWHLRHFCIGAFYVNSSEEFIEAFFSNFDRYTKGVLHSSQVSMYLNDTHRYLIFSLGT